MPEIIHVNRPGAAGDIIMTLQVIEKYKKLHPDIKVIYYCDPFYKELPRLSFAVNEIKPSSEFNFNLSNSVNFYGYSGYPLLHHLMYNFCKEMGLDDNCYNYGFNPIFYPSSNPDLNSLLASKKNIITFHCTAGWSPYKNWQMNNWQELVNRINKLNNYILVQIGAKEDPVLTGVINTMGKFSIVESIRLIKSAYLHLGVDSFSNHATALLPYTPGIILWGSTSPLEFGYGHNVNVWKPLKCSPCHKQYDWKILNPNGKCPLDKLQTWETPLHPCMANITVDEVFIEILKLIKNND